MRGLAWLGGVAADAASGSRTAAVWVAGARKTGARWALALGFGGLVAVGGDAARAEEPYAATDGVYVGHVLGKPAERVTVELRQRGVVVLDDANVRVAEVDGWSLAGPGGKGGDLQLKAVATAKSWTTRAGKALAVRVGAKSAVRLRVFPEQKTAMFCASAPDAKTGAPRRVPAPGSGEGAEPGVTCYDLVRVWQPGGVVKDADFECMRECRQQNMMRAVGIEQIEADCKATCTK